MIVTVSNTWSWKAFIDSKQKLMIGFIPAIY